jgi:hypothetical protein
VTALKLSKSRCAPRTHEQLWRLDVIERSRNKMGGHENGRLVLSTHRLLKYEKQRKKYWAAVTKKEKAGDYFGKSHATVARRNLQRGEKRGERHERQRCNFPLWRQQHRHLCSRVVQTLAARVLVNEASLPGFHACTPA